MAIKLLDIKKAIVDILKIKFPSVNIVPEDVEEGFNKPAFFIKIDFVNRNTKLYVLERNFTARIHYFKSIKDGSSLDLLYVQDDLESVFNLNFQVKDRVITIDDTRGQTVDKVLEFEFDFKLTESNGINDEGELMEELDLNV